MKNVYDFLRKYGKEELNLETFSEADTLVFCALSYLDIRHIIRDGESREFYDIFSLENSISLCKIGWMPDRDFALLTVLKRTTRYKNIIVRRSKPVLRNDISTQFFAVEFLIPNVATFIIFRGTDKTFLGCVEDIRFALDQDVGSIQIAKDYVLDALNASANPVYLIGHSKGGTVAEVCYLRLDKEDRDRVIRVYNLDGPGTKYGVPEEMLPEANAKISKFITKRSVFGILLKTNYNHKFINGRAWWLTHHLVYNWEVQDKSLVRVPGPSRRSLRRRKAVDDFVSKRTNEQLLEIIEDVEGIMKEGDLFLFKDLRLVSWFRAHVAVFKLLRSKRRWELIKFNFMCMRAFL